MRRRGLDTLLGVGALIAEKTRGGGGEPRTAGFLH